MLLACLIEIDLKEKGKEEFLWANFKNITNGRTKAISVKYIWFFFSL